ncbi:hypothetical protein [Brumimicrobium aurantiacum]|uniref:XRE family transcriptional regulator n=1 Tax=Brumimicrobium aurantiacum TaxID=1737063 RepID=A0A3E1EZ97_9FLAO|nr:hypothetical protein [Brumimicrobium aurantiacum]RFC54875.1 hypothetical protein DXU93_03375 [Brumimicrobium aurantiacum]
MMYKYNFLLLMLQMPLKEYKKADQFIPEALNISYSTWKSWKYIKVGDPREVRPEQLMVISSFFECTVDDLIYKDENQHRDLREEFKTLDQ